MQCISKSNFKIFHFSNLKHSSTLPLNILTGIYISLLAQSFGSPTATSSPKIFTPTHWIKPSAGARPSPQTTPVYPSSHMSKMLINHTAFVSVYASTPLTHTPKGLEACQDNHFHLILFKKVNPLMTFHFQVMKCVRLRALQHWAAHHSRNCPHRSYQRLIEVFFHWSYRAYQGRFKGY